jgi:hypothetical protein
MKLSGALVGHESIMARCSPQRTDTHDPGINAVTVRRSARHVMAYECGFSAIRVWAVGSWCLGGNSVPHVRIEIVKGWSLEERQRLFQVVHDALMEAFRIPDDDRTQRIVEHEPENFEIPPGSSDRYTLIEITAFPGRSADAKRKPLPDPRPKARRDRHRSDGRLGGDPRAHAGELGRSRRPLRCRRRPGLLARRLTGLKADPKVASAGPGGNVDGSASRAGARDKLEHVRQRTPPV